VAYLRQKRGVNFRSNKVGAGKLKRKYLNQIYSALAAKVLSAIPLKALFLKNGTSETQLNENLCLCTNHIFYKFS
jgi:hypothetical protein